MTTGLLDEQRKVAEPFEEAHTIRAIAMELADLHVREALIRSTDRMIAATIDPVRLRIVTYVLHFDDKTIRRWVDLGILPAVTTSKRARLMFFSHPLVGGRTAVLERSMWRRCAAVMRGAPRLEAAG
jgi:hypothetical protein